MFWFCKPVHNRTEAWTYDNETGSFSWKYWSARIGTRSKICKIKYTLKHVNTKLLTWNGIVYICQTKVSNVQAKTESIQNFTWSTFLWYSYDTHFVIYWIIFLKLIFSFVETFSFPKSVEHYSKLFVLL